MIDGATAGIVLAQVGPAGANPSVALDPWSIGGALAVLGMGGTLFSLGLLSALIVLLKRVLPYSPESEK